MIGMIHTIFLNGINCGVHITTTTVKVSSMYVNHQWFARYLFCMNTGRISQPVM